MKIYFVATNNTADKEVIKIVKPKMLLLSYHYFKNIDLEEYKKELGYDPIVLLDSGAYSAWSKGKNISPIDFMNYISKNDDHIYRYIALDVIGDAEISYIYYKIMKLKGFNPIPVFHYGDDEKYLRLFIEDGNDYIALGNTVPIKDKKKVADWVNELINKYPDTKFHLLGSSSKKITQGTNVYSCDSSSWIMMALNGYPKEIKGKTREAKIERAIWQMTKTIEEVESI
ncbi:hypothetical protein ABEY43_07140 [Priestia megaterium]